MQCCYGIVVQSINCGNVRSIDIVGYCREGIVGAMRQELLHCQMEGRVIEFGEEFEQKVLVRGRSFVFEGGYFDVEGVAVFCSAMMSCSSHVRHARERRDELSKLRETRQTKCTEVSAALSSGKKHIRHHISFQADDQRQQWASSELTPSRSTLESCE